MDMQNAIGIPYGTDDTNRRELLAVRDVLDFPLNVTSIAYNPGISGSGSSRWKYGWQTIFVDNTSNSMPLFFECYGTLFQFQVPARTQGFYPLACPINSFGLSIRCNTPEAIKIPVTLFDGVISPSSWQGTLLGNRRTAGLTYQFNIAETSTAFDNANALVSSFIIKNIGQSKLYLGINMNPNVGSGYPLEIGESIRIDNPLPNSVYRAIAEAPNGRVAVIVI